MDQATTHFAGELYTPQRAEFGSPVMIVVVRLASAAASKIQYQGQRLIDGQSATDKPAVVRRPIGAPAHEDRGLAQPAPVCVSEAHLADQFRRHPGVTGSPADAAVATR